jgi:signal transduction histidine kinase
MRLSKFKKIEKSRTNINDFVNEFISEFPLPKRIKLTTGLDNECPDIMVDGPQIRQVFTNIASNAVHAIPEDGTLTVKTRRVLSSELGVQSEEGKDSKLKGDFVEITFADTGDGMKKETMEKIFDPFFTTGSKGMGLGLSIVKEIIASNDGNISVESEEGKGSTFKVIFPGVRD